MTGRETPIYLGLLTTLQNICETVKQSRVQLLSMFTICCSRILPALTSIFTHPARLSSIDMNPQLSVRRHTHTHTHTHTHARTHARMHAHIHTHTHTLSEFTFSRVFTSMFVLNFIDAFIYSNSDVFIGR